MYFAGQSIWPHMNMLKTKIYFKRVYGVRGEHEVIFSKIRFDEHYSYVSLNDAIKDLNYDISIFSFKTFRVFLLKEYNCPIDLSKEKVKEFFEMDEFRKAVFLAARK